MYTTGMNLGRAAHQVAPQAHKNNKKKQKRGGSILEETAAPEPNGCGSIFAGVEQKIKLHFDGLDLYTASTTVCAADVILCCCLPLYNIIFCLVESIHQQQITLGEFAEALLHALCCQRLLAARPSTSYTSSNDISEIKSGLPPVNLQQQQHLIAAGDLFLVIIISTSAPKIGREL